MTYAPTGATTSGRLAGALAIAVLFGLTAVLVLVPLAFLVALSRHDDATAVHVVWVKTGAPYRDALRFYVPCAYRTDWYGMADLKCDFASQVLGPDTKPADEAKPDSY